MTCEIMQIEINCLPCNFIVHEITNMYNNTRNWCTYLVLQLTISICTILDKKRYPKRFGGLSASVKWGKKLKILARPSERKIYKENTKLYIF